MHLAAAHRGPIDILITDTDMRIFQNGMELAACFQVLRPEARVLLRSQAGLAGGLAHFSDQDLGDAWSFLPNAFSEWDLLEAVKNLASADGETIGR